MIRLGITFGTCYFNSDNYFCSRRTSCPFDVLTMVACPRKFWSSPQLVYGSIGSPFSKSLAPTRTLAPICRWSSIFPWRSLCFELYLTDDFTWQDTVRMRIRTLVISDTDANNISEEQSCLRRSWSPWFHVTPYQSGAFLRKVYSIAC